MQRGFLAGVSELLVGGMPGGRTAIAEQSHGDGGGVDDPDALVREEGQIREKLLIEQSSAAVSQNRRYRTRIHLIHLSRRKKESRDGR